MGANMLHVAKRGIVAIMALSILYESLLGIKIKLNFNILDHLAQKLKKSIYFLN